jgi:excisionase family DNA binding protein
MHPEPIAPALMTVKDAAKYLAVSERTLYSLTISGRITAVVIGLRCKRYERAALDRFIETCKGTSL